MAEALSRWTRGQPLSPLLARLAIERAKTTGSLPSTYPQLVHEYVAALRHPSSSALSEEDYFRAARIIAKLSVDEELSPRSVNADLLRGWLGAESEHAQFCDEQGRTVVAAQVVEQLVRSGLLLRSVELATVRIRFSDDPIAEYLYAMHVALQPTNVIETLSARISLRPQEAQGLAEALAQVLHPRPL